MGEESLIHLKLAVLFFNFAVQQEKRLRQARKYPNQPVVGFRYVGMRWASFYEGGEQPRTVQKGKDWGANMLVENYGLGMATWVLRLFVIIV